MTEVLQDEPWSIEEIRHYVRILAAEYGLEDQVTDSLVLRFATLAQGTFDIALFMVSEDSDIETAAVLDFTSDIRVLISNYFQQLMATLQHHKNLRGYEHVRTQD